MCNAFAWQGTNVAIVSIGNEVNSGILWPLGNPFPGTGDNFTNFSQLLHSAARGVRDSNLFPIPKIAIHLANGWNWSDISYFFSKILNVDPTDHRLLTSHDFDIVGLSFYPFYNSEATLSALNSSIANIQSNFGKRVVIAETDWPVECTSPQFSFPADTVSIPLSPAGQIKWVEDLASVLKVQNGYGLYYWEPAWVQNPSLGSSCEDTLMFNPATDEARSSLSVFLNL